MTRPWISCNLAVSADGKLSDSMRRASTWTSATDRARLLELRQPAEALMVGRGTLETDRMTLRVPGKSRQPLRCVVSRHGRISADHPLFHSDGGPIHLLASQGYDGSPTVTATIHEQSLAAFLDSLKSDYQVNHLHCEGGGELIRSLAEIDAIDELHLTLAGHTLFGGQVAPTLTGLLNTHLARSCEFSLHHFQPDESTGECYLTYRRRGIQ